MKDHQEASIELVNAVETELISKINETYQASISLADAAIRFRRSALEAWLDSKSR